MSKERELLEKAVGWLHDTYDGVKYMEALLNEIDVYLAEPAQEPKPVTYINGTYGGRICIKLLNQSLVVPDGMALYTTPPDAAKRIAELESACKAHAELHEINEKRIFDLEGAIGVVNGEYALLRDCYNEVTDRIANGVRVYAWEDELGRPNVDESVENPKLFNATLLLDEQGD